MNAQISGTIKLISLSLNKLKKKFFKTDDVSLVILPLLLTSSTDYPSQIDYLKQLSWKVILSNNRRKLKNICY